MSLTASRSSRADTMRSLLIAALCLALAVQGAHTCQLVDSASAADGAFLVSSTPQCPICAVSQSLIVTLILIFFALVSSQSRAFSSPVRQRAFWRGLRLDLRAPPSF